MPRRRAVRILVGVVAAAFVPGARAQPFGSRRTTCTPPPGGKVCRCPSINGLFYIECCPAPASDWDCQCYPPPGGGAQCVPKKCASGHQCGGDVCCEAGKHCVNTRTHLCCEDQQTGCGDQCCKKNEECVVARVGVSSSHVCVPRCPEGQARCGPSKCCPKNFRCANSSTGLCKRCPPGQEECGKKCCPSSSQCCGTAGCCPKDRSCCSSNGKQICCPSGQKCAIPIAPGDIGVQPGAAAICCPRERLHLDPNVCCPPGEMALSGPGMRVGPGLSPYCCPAERMCGDTCCQSSPTLGTETCCNGVCIDVTTDRNNCGSCGHVCAPNAVCRGGQCALA